MDNTDKFVTSLPFRLSTFHSNFQHELIQGDKDPDNFVAQRHSRSPTPLPRVVDHTTSSQPLGVSSRLLAVQFRRHSSPHSRLLAANFQIQP
jgi:hypothetical protein